MRLLYSLLYTVAFLAALPYFLLVGLLRGKYLSTLKQRLGSIPVHGESSIWVHTVSVGEFLAAKPLIHAIKAEFPDLACFVSTTTITGQQLAAKAFPGAVFYFPFDWKWCVRKVFAAIRPRLILVLETEIWPSFLWEAQEQNVPVILVNGRLSDRSYSRYRMIRSWLPHFDKCLMQSAESAERMKSLALSREPIEVMGNLKFDFAPPTIAEDLKRRLLEWKGNGLILVAGSTMPGEEEALLSWLQRLQSSFPLKLLLAPRHPERFEEVESLIHKTGFSMIKRSEEEKSGQAPVFLLNSIGELAGTYEIADLVFIGGTLQNFGGHNPIEPAYFGKAIVTGPHYDNFRAVYHEFLVNKAILVSDKPEEAVTLLLKDADLRASLGACAANLVKKNRGATRIVLESMRSYLGRSVVEPDPQSFI